MAAVVAVAACLRLVDLAWAPPGLHQDEAANAWNAWLLLNTVRDQAGQPWPLFYFRALGENRTPLYLYWLVPFQVLGGLNTWTTRLPNVVGGVLCVLLIAYIGARWLGRGVGLAAAAILTIGPWAIHQSRWGHEGAATLLFTLIPIAAWTWAALPGFRREEARPRAARALVAGLLTGICCYGYPSLRIFLPAFFALAVLAAVRDWWSALRLRSGRLAGAALLAGVLVTFGPLAWRHVVDPGINKRGVHTWVWADDDPLPARVAGVAARYPGHFGPDYLFLRGDRHHLMRGAAGGQLHAYEAPLLLCGLIVLVVWLRTAPSAVLLLWLVAYPVGDMLNDHPMLDRAISMHGLRSMPGLGALALVAGLGLATVLDWLRSRQRWLSVAVGAAVLAVAAASSGRFMMRMLTGFYDTPMMYHGYHVDLVAACAWLRPELARQDEHEVLGVFFTMSPMPDGPAFNQPYITTAVALGHNPHAWHREPIDRVLKDPWDVYYSYGRIHFMYPGHYERKLADLVESGRPGRIVLVLRPGEEPQFMRSALPPHLEITRPDGVPALRIYAFRVDPVK